MRRIYTNLISSSAVALTLSLGLSVPSHAADAQAPGKLKQENYANYEVTNRTKWTTSGQISQFHGGAFGCNNDPKFDNVQPGATWRAKGSRGACLVVSVAARLHTDKGDVKCKEFSSSGTSYAKFQIVGDENKCEVSRP
jgi:hypothetical protein